MTWNDVMLKKNKILKHNNQIVKTSKDSTSYLFIDNKKLELFQLIAYIYPMIIKN